MFFLLAVSAVRIALLLDRGVGVVPSSVSQFSTRWELDLVGPGWLIF